ncbi:hypothetical protein CEUSTIGMA_g11539.t1 [Chlamydomonas eustigma]|uniref:Uncharacterized protein n=1 Tax=Chlamydomonas eustigma TaxID=1157962 RepID=A0A250XM67_9CHLO|nr:hypothetical protein CEUSTIGMA_g11539.t1 [Chlamydomonas eustigma]|eukprot:GAX84116.1 hypothetical protein CEUSTIGMA_g11539.t1 [Chlamydomonas eustigma]
MLGSGTAEGCDHSSLEQATTLHTAQHDAGTSAQPFVQPGGPWSPSSSAVHADLLELPVLSGFVDMMQISAGRRGGCSPPLKLLSSLTETNIKYLRSIEIAEGGIMELGAVPCALLDCDVAASCHNANNTDDGITMRMSTVLPPFSQALRIGPPMCLMTSSDTCGGGICLLRSRQKAGQKLHSGEGMMHVHTSANEKEKSILSVATTWQDHHASTRMMAMMNRKSTSSSGNKVERLGSDKRVVITGSTIMPTSGGFGAIIAQDLNLRDVDADLYYVLPMQPLACKIASTTSTHLLGSRLSEPSILSASSASATWRSAFLHLQNVIVHYPAAVSSRGVSSYYHCNHESSALASVHDSSSLDLYLDWSVIGNIPEDTAVLMQQKAHIGSSSNHRNALYEVISAAPKMLWKQLHPSFSTNTSFPVFVDSASSTITSTACPPGHVQTYDEVQPQDDELLHLLKDIMLSGKQRRQQQHLHRQPSTKTAGTFLTCCLDLLRAHSTSPCADNKLLDLDPCRACCASPAGNNGTMTIGSITDDAVQFHSNKSAAAAQNLADEAAGQPPMCPKRSQQEAALPNKILDIEKCIVPFPHVPTADEELTRRDLDVGCSRSTSLKIPLPTVHNSRVVTLDPSSSDGLESSSVCHHHEEGSRSISSVEAAVAAAGAAIQPVAAGAAIQPVAAAGAAIQPVAAAGAAIQPHTSVNAAVSVSSNSHVQLLKGLAKAEEVLISRILKLPQLQGGFEACSEEVQIILNSDLWQPGVPEQLMKSLQARLALLQVRKTPSSNNEKASDEKSRGAPTEKNEDSELTAAVQRVPLTKLLQLCTALAIVRRTACCIRTCGIMVAYLYLKHMLQKTPRSPILLLMYQVSYTVADVSGSA